MEFSRDLFREKRKNWRPPDSLSGEDVAALDGVLKSTEVNKGVNQLELKGLKYSSISLDAMMAAGGSCIIGQGEGGQVAAVVRGQELIADGLRKGGQSDAQLAAYQSGLMAQAGIQRVVADANERVRLRKEGIEARKRDIESRISSLKGKAPASSGDSSAVAPSHASASGAQSSSIYSASTGTVHTAGGQQPIPPQLGWESDDER